MADNTPHAEKPSNSDTTDLLIAAAKTLLFFLVVDAAAYLFFLILDLTTETPFKCGQHYLGWECVLGGFILPACASNTCPVNSTTSSCCPFKGQLGFDSAFDKNIIYLVTSIASLGGSMYLLFAFARSPNFRKMFHLQIIATSSVFHFGFALKFFVTSVVVLLRGGPVSPTGSWGCYLVGLWTTFFGQGSTLCMAALTLNLAVMLALPLRYVAWSQQGTVFTCFYLLVGGVATAVTAASLWWGDIRVTSDLSC